MHRHCLNSYFPLIVCAFLAPIAGFASVEHISFKKAMTDKLISVTAVSNGGYCNKGLHLNITNNTRKPLELDIDPALIFSPADSIYQDLAVLGSESIAIAPSGKKEIDVQTFCAKSFAHAPVANIGYKFWKQGDDVMIKVLKYAKDSATLGMTQHAVWALTNGHSVSSIYDQNKPEQSKRFMSYVADLKHVKCPDYFTQYHMNNKPGQSICNKKVEKQYVDLRWGYEHRFMLITIYKEDYSVYKIPQGGDSLDAKGHHLVITFDPKRDPRGHYIVEMKDAENRVWAKKEVVVGED
jgi:hypothetical protein